MCGGDIVEVGTGRKGGGWKRDKERDSKTTALLLSQRS